MKFLKAYSQHMKIYDLNWPATSRPSYTMFSLVAHVSVTAWLAAAKLGRLVLSQFWTHVFDCGSLHWRNIQFANWSPVQFMWEGLYTNIIRAATSFAAWWTEAQWVWTVCLRLLPDSIATATAFCVWVQHADHSATDPLIQNTSIKKQRNRTTMED